jgi:CubicO group peptidase (beta-lactamase class C family)
MTACMSCAASGSLRPDWLYSSAGSHRPGCVGAEFLQGIATHLGAATRCDRFTLILGRPTMSDPTVTRRSLMVTRGRSAMIAALAALVAVMLAGCVHTESVPTRRWNVSTPEDQGMESERLNSISTYVQGQLPDTTSVVVVRHGHIVFEEYFDGDRDTLRSLASVTKSVVSALIGIAVDQGLIASVDDPMISYLPQFDTPDLNPNVRDVTIRHLLTLTSGFNDTTSPRLTSEAMKKMLESPDHLPAGSTWEYRGNCFTLLSMIISETTGDTMEGYAREHLFGPLGITEHSWVGVLGFTMGDGGLALTSRDLAKIGLLYLGDGMWGEAQVVSAGWVRESTRMYSDLTELLGAARPMGYGHGWWVSGWGASPAYIAFGSSGQYLYVVPDLDLAVVITADDSYFAPFPKYLPIVQEYVIPAAIE